MTPRRVVHVSTAQTYLQHTPKGRYLAPKMMSSRVLRTAGRRFASTTAAPAPSAQPIKVLHSTSNASGAVLGNIEATWVKLPKEEQYEVYRTLEEVQKRDWKQLTVDEKKACECLKRVVEDWKGR